MSVPLPEIRYPAVAGTFYQGDPHALRHQIARCFLEAPGPGRQPQANASGPRRIVGLVAPHAGYVYSGYTAAHAYLHLAEDGLVDVAVILAPNHHGLGADNAVWPAGAWITPLGRVPVASEVAEAIRKSTSLVRADPLAHRHDHAVEVHLPFLQVVYGSGFSIVPISMKAYALDVSIEVGEAIATALEGRNAVVIASSDFSHYERADRAREQDARVLGAIERLDPADVFRQVLTYDITTCGYGPVAAMLVAARAMGATAARTLHYTTSGDITGDFRRVVGYAAVEVVR